MAKVLDETETSLETTVPREEGQDNATKEDYMRKKSLILDFLCNYLNPHLLQYHWSKFHLLKKCYFYLKIEPRHLYVRDENNMICTDILQVANPCQWQKIKKMGRNQTEIQLALLKELLEQLEQGRKELSHYVEICDVATFLSQWNLTVRRVLKLSMHFSKLIALEKPSKLYFKHSLVPQVILGVSAHPQINLSLYIKKPPVFDRRESFASLNWAQIKWINENQESYFELWQLEIKLVTDDSQTEQGHSWIEQVISNPCVIHHLQPGRLYEFRVKRSNSQTLVYSQWYDHIVLKTKTTADENTYGSSMRCLTETSYVS